MQRRRTEPAAPLPPGSFTPAGPEAPPLLVPGWPNDPTYKTYINSKGLPPGAAAAALASYGRSGRLGTSRPGGKGKGSLGLAPLGGMGSPGRAPLTSPTQSHRRVDGAVTAAAAAIGMDTAVAGLLESSRQCVQKVSCRKGPSGSRTYTSKYRGVHQTFPTRRWEAQFRRAGKPTSLGCFNLEEEAARAYDKMMLWCEIHHADLRSLGARDGSRRLSSLLTPFPLFPGLLRNGVTNFPAAAYAVDMPALREMTQDELVAELRRMGRLQAASGAPRGAGKAAQEGKADQDGRAASA